MLNVGQIFLGVIPASMRPFVKRAFEVLRETGKYEKIIIPCCGNFTIPLVAADAGWEPKNIITSDISLYTTALGYAIQGRPFEELSLDISHPYWDLIRDKTGKEGYPELFVLMKTLQLRDEVSFENDYIDNLLKSCNVYAEQIRESLSAMQAKLNGVVFRPRDLRVEIEEFADTPVIMSLNPPLYRAGYEKMFQFKGVFKDWRSIDVEEFDWATEYQQVYETTTAKRSIQLWYYCAELAHENAKQAVFGIDKGKGKHEWFLCNRPEEIPKELKQIRVKRGIDIKPIKTAVFSEKDVISPDSKIHFKVATAENALYYRSVWTHRLGETVAELYLLWFIDGKLFSTTGFHLQDLFILRSDELFESFGFSVPHKKYPNINRLLMMCLTSGQFLREVQNTPSMQTNKIYVINGFKTTCLSKYRKIKLNNGLLEIAKCEKQPNGIYKILYRAPFRKKDSYAKCVNRYLEELERKKNGNSN